MDRNKFIDNIKNIREKYGDREFIQITSRMGRKISKGLLEYKTTLDDFNNIVSEVDRQYLQESVFDPINDKRSDVVFGKDEKMKPSIREYILKIFNEWKDNHEVKFNVKSMYMIGSMTGFQYHSTSDIDINVITDANDKDIWKLRRTLPSGNTVEGTSHPINFWVGERGYVYEEKRAENIYDILEDKWIKKTDKMSHEVPYQYVMEVSKFFMDGFDLAISETERDIAEVNVFLEYDPKKQNVTEKEKRAKVSDKVNELKADVDRLKIGRHILRSFMVEGYEGMPFRVSINYKNEDPRLSMNFLVYKMIDRLGYHDTKIPNAIEAATKAIELGEKYLKSEVEE